MHPVQTVVIPIHIARIALVSAIEVTPEMQAAGASVLVAYNTSKDAPSDVADSIFNAMLKVYLLSIAAPSSQDVNTPPPKELGRDGEGGVPAPSSILVRELSKSRHVLVSY